MHRCSYVDVVHWCFSRQKSKHDQLPTGIHYSSWQDYPEWSFMSSCWPWLPQDLTSPMRLHCIGTLVPTTERWMLLTTVLPDSSELHEHFRLHVALHSRWVVIGWPVLHGTIPVHLSVNAFRNLSQFQVQLLFVINYLHIHKTKKCLGLISFFLFSSSQSPGQDSLQICDVAVIAGILLVQGTDTAPPWLSVVVLFASGKDNGACRKVATEFHFCFGIIYKTKNMARTNMKINLKYMKVMNVITFFNQCLFRTTTVSDWWAADSLVRSYHV